MVFKKMCGSFKRIKWLHKYSQNQCFASVKQLNMFQQISNPVYFKGLVHIFVPAVNGGRTGVSTGSSA